MRAAEAYLILTALACVLLCVLAQGEEEQKTPTAEDLARFEEARARFPVGQFAGTFNLKVNDQEIPLYMTFDKDGMAHANEFCAQFGGCPQESLNQIADLVDEQLRTQHFYGRTNLSFKQAFKKLFHFTEEYDTFDEYHLNSERGDAFESWRDFWVYRTLSGTTLMPKVPNKQYIFDHFMFHFYRSPPVANKVVDDARNINAGIANVLAQEDGNASVKATNVIPFNGVPSNSSATENSAQNVLFLTWLLDHIGTENLKNMDIVEIGAGAGVACRLIGNTYGFRSYTILDIPHVSDQQEWYLSETLRNGAEIVRNKGAEYQSAGGRPLVNLVDVDHLNIWNARFTRTHIVLASQSLSETGWDDFYWYWKNVLPFTDHLLYIGGHFPTIEVWQQKLALIAEIMDRDEARGDPLVVKKDMAHHLYKAKPKGGQCSGGSCASQPSHTQPTQQGFGAPPATAPKTRPRVVF